ncbi:MAG: caspase family protein [Candidatus Symbiothrix sp.]|jgi:hypothetical protein|nr:caspase family protein [Candidatus Symbiothrix sp.]
MLNTWRTIIISLFCTCFVPVQATSRALIVAIAEYPKKSGWQPIHANNDVLVVKSGLLKQGFSIENITVLRDRAATKQGILNAFDQLLQQSVAGDRLMVHFSMHGQQVTDLNGDEADGLDEALVAYDAPKYNKQNARSADKHLIDDELNKLLLALRKKVGKKGSVLIFVDACHSGTINRGAQKPETVIRGTGEIFEIRGVETVARAKRIPSLYVDDNQPVDNSALAPFLLISACAEDQNNKEYRDCYSNKSYGPLSYALSVVLSKNRIAVTNDVFFEQIKAEMAKLDAHYESKQTPQKEGNAHVIFFSPNFSSNSVDASND